MLTPAHRHIFVTGATGFVGSHFVSRWLQSRVGTVSALVRDRNGSPGLDRLLAALKTARSAAGDDSAEDLGTLHAIDGDIAHNMCGLDTLAVEWLRELGPSVFWHFASDLRYEDRNSEIIRHTNINGARNALDLASAIGAERFVYVSTAYVCGRLGGQIEEVLHPQSISFSNTYEESKAHAEHLLARECSARGLPLTILRPSIVVGPSSTRRSEGTGTGLFALMHAVMWISASRAATVESLRVAACPEAEINLIPVDCVVSDMINLAEAGFGKQMIYHLTSASSISVAQCWEAISEATGIHNIVLAPAGSFELSAPEQLIARRIGFFLDYITVDRKFTRSLTPAWAVDVEGFHGYVRNIGARLDEARDPAIATAQGPRM